MSLRTLPTQFRQGQRSLLINFVYYFEEEVKQIVYGLPRAFPLHKSVLCHIK